MSAMIETHLIEAVLSSLFDFLKKKVVITPSDRAKVDFLIRGENDKKIAIEVKKQMISNKIVKDIQSIIIDYGDLSEFYLITPEEPKNEYLKEFESFFTESETKVFWLSINQFLQSQNLDLKLTDDVRNSLINLQVATLTSKYESYNKKHIGPDLGLENLAKSLKINIENVNSGKIDKSDIRFELRRQFPDSIISKLTNDSENISEYLNFGSKYDDAIIILSDIKNFSNIVYNSDPDELNELMSKYYANARELVFKYDGVLDKFIGDAVLAIFNFPARKVVNYKKAIEFCSELILVGESLLNEFQKKLDHKIDTGTRIGVTTGPIYPLNIGKEGFEVNFIGDKINFAARLEKICEVNGILMSNRFYHKLYEHDSHFLMSLESTEIVIDPKDAKGQNGITSAWQVIRDQMEIIIMK